MPITQPDELTLTPAPARKIYFASDFHLGVPTEASSREREKKIVRWLDQIAPDAEAIFLLGDIFDFWFEYRYVIPRGFLQFLAKMTELRNRGIQIYFFTGNHDMWMFDYFPHELGIPIYRKPVRLKTGSHTWLIGHGDGLGPGDYTYKWLKKFFNSRICQWMFARLHPNFGMGVAHFWSRQSRISNQHKKEKFVSAENEFLWKYCEAEEARHHHDFYVFGHRHLPLDLAVPPSARYINLGEWVHFCTYAEYDGTHLHLKTFTG